MASRKDRRARSRKRRATVSTAPARPPAVVVPPAAAPAVARPARARGERPRPPWHPLPLSEILIAAGLVGLVVGLGRGSNGGAPLFAGLAAAAVGTFEVTLREHRGGFRSHTIFLAVLPAVIFHSAAVLIVSAFGHVGRTLNLAFVAADVAIFLLMFRLLRARYLQASLDRAAGRR